MVYRRRKRFSFIQLIVLGILAGVLFFIVDSLGRRGTAPTAPPTTPPATVTAAGMTEQDPTQPPAVTSVNRPLPGQTTLFIPSAGIFTPIVEVFLDGSNWDVTQLGNNVGHLEGTAWVNSPGNVALSGHVELSDGRKGVFANLDELEVGALIEIQQGADVWRYAVTEVGVTEPDDLTPLYPTEEARLTLITCGSYDFFQDTYLERIIVTATRIG